MDLAIIADGGPTFPFYCYCARELIEFENKGFGHRADGGPTVGERFLFSVIVYVS